MSHYHTIKIKDTIISEIDILIKTGLYTSRAEYVNELIRNDIQKRILEGIV